MVFCKRPRLLDFAKTPTHLQFNKYVLTGYRPVSTAQECLRSLFYMHNELGNIYTHGESRGHCMMVRFSLIRDRLSNRWDTLGFVLRFLPSGDFFPHYLCIISRKMSTPALYMKLMHKQKGTDYSVTLTGGQLQGCGVLAVICPGSLCPGNILLLTKSLKVLVGWCSTPLVFIWITKKTFWIFFLFQIGCTINKTVKTFLHFVLLNWNVESKSCAEMEP